MNLYPPIYPGESILHPSTFPGGNFDSIWDKAALHVGFVHSNINVDTKPEIGFDLLAIEQQARAARNAWIASELKSAYAAVARKLGRPGRTA